MRCLLALLLLLLLAPIARADWTGESSCAPGGVNAGKCVCAEPQNSGTHNEGRSNAACISANTPYDCCTGAGTGDCWEWNSISNAACTANHTPQACCTGAGAGTCGSATSNGWQSSDAVCAVFPLGASPTCQSWDMDDSEDATECYPRLVSANSLEESCASGPGLQAVSAASISTMLAPGHSLSWVLRHKGQETCHQGFPAVFFDKSTGQTVCQRFYKMWDPAGALPGGTFFSSTQGCYPDFCPHDANCGGPGAPYSCCTGVGTGTCNATYPTCDTDSCPVNSLCLATSVPWGCCSGPGSGSCNALNASCIGLGNPYNCCSGAGTGICHQDSAACTGVRMPWGCCTGVGVGTCELGDGQQCCEPQQKITNWAGGMSENPANPSFANGDPSGHRWQNSIPPVTTPGGLRGQIGVTGLAGNVELFDSGSFIGQIPTDCLGNFCRLEYCADFQTNGTLSLRARRTSIIAASGAGASATSDGSCGPGCTTKNGQHTTTVNQSFYTTYGYNGGPMYFGQFTPELTDYMSHWVITRTTYNPNYWPGGATEVEGSGPGEGPRTRGGSFRGNLRSALEWWRLAEVQKQILQGPM